MSRYRVKGVCARWYPLSISYGVGVPAEGDDALRVCPKCRRRFGPGCLWRLMRCEPLGFAMRVHVACQGAREVAAVGVQLGPAVGR